MSDISNKITQTLNAAGLNPRCLAAVANVHHTTVYKYIKQEDSAKVPAVRAAIEVALGKIEDLTSAGMLPLEGDLSLDKKIERLLSLIAKKTA